MILLIADNEVGILEVLEDIFEEDFGVRTEIAEDEATASALVDILKFDLIIVDFRLGHGENGVDFIKRAREKVGERTKFLVFTCWVNEAREYAQKVGVKIDGLLGKPTGLLELEEKIRELTGVSLKKRRTR